MDFTSTLAVAVGLLGSLYLAYDRITSQRIKNQQTIRLQAERALGNDGPTTTLRYLNREARARFWEEQARVASAAGRQGASDTCLELAWQAREGHQ